MHCSDTHSWLQLSVALCDGDVYNAICHGSTHAAAGDDNLMQMFERTQEVKSKPSIPGDERGGLCFHFLKMNKLQSRLIFYLEVCRRVNLERKKKAFFVIIKVTLYFVRSIIWIRDSTAFDTLLLFRPETTPCTFPASSVRHLLTSSETVIVSTSAILLPSDQQCLVSGMSQLCRRESSQDSC